MRYYGFQPWYRYSQFVISLPIASLGAILADIAAILSLPAMGSLINLNIGGFYR